MSEKVTTRNDRGEPVKMPGWFSWRHQTREACDAAREAYGGRRAERLARKRAEAAERDAALPADSPRRRRNREVAR